MDVYAYFTARDLGEAPGNFKAYTMFVIEKKTMPQKICDLRKKCINFKPNLLTVILN